jgi:hypothetical protein
MIKLSGIAKPFIREADADSVAGADHKKALKLRKPLRNAIQGVGNSIDNIDRMMSSFNSPGLRVAFLNAIKKGIASGGQKFDMRRALKDFDDYYKGR